MRVANSSTCVALGDDVVGDALGHPFVEDEVLSDELVAQPLSLRLTGVLNDAPFELMHVLETLVLQVGAGLFAANATSAIHDDVGVLLSLKHVLNVIDFLAKRVDVRTNSTLKMPYLAFIGIAHVNQHRVLLIREFIELHGFEVLAAIGHVKCTVGETIRHNLVAHPNDQFEKALALLYGDVQAQIGEPSEGLNVGFERLEAFSRNGDLGVDAFFGDIRSAQHFQVRPSLVQLCSGLLRVFEVHIPIKAQRCPRPSVSVHPGFQHAPIFDVVEPFHSNTKVRQDPDAHFQVC